MGSCVSYLNVSLIVWAKSQDSVHKPQFSKRKESRSGSNRGPSAYQPSALPLGHTGSRLGRVSGLTYLPWNRPILNGACLCSVGPMKGLWLVRDISPSPIIIMNNFLERWLPLWATYLRLKALYHVQVKLNKLLIQLKPNKERNQRRQKTNKSQGRAGKWPGPNIKKTTNYILHNPFSHSVFLSPPLPPLVSPPISHFCTHWQSSGPIWLLFLFQI